MANFRVGECFADAILHVINKHNIDPKDIQLIGSHGQTVWHEVVEEKSKDGTTALKVLGTLQIGEAAVIAHKTGITTIADFRGTFFFTFHSKHPQLQM